MGTEGAGWRCGGGRLRAKALNRQELGYIARVVDDETLLERWRQGDSTAGSMLLERHHRSLYYFFANKVDGEIDDLVQNTLLACVSSRDRFRGCSTFRTYLFTIARNELYGYLRARKRTRDQLDYGVTSLSDLGITPRSRIARKNQYHLLLEALRSLPINQQILLELRYWERASVAELAEIFQVGHDAIHARLSRVRKSLHKRLRELAHGSAPQYETLEDLDTWARSVRAARSDDGDDDNRLGMP